MSDTHPNVALISRLDIHDIAASKDVFAEDAVFRYFNPLLPDLQGDYVGLAGIRAFFQKIGALSAGTFRIEPVSATAVGDELVVVHTRNSLTFDNQPITMDVVVVWRIVNGRVTEVWDIPSVYAAEQQTG
ncbi:MAG: nuclear transport factor 2 family protein [Pseudomonadota bacterium]